MKTFKYLFILSILLCFGTVSAGHKHKDKHKHKHKHENECQIMEGYIQIYPTSDGGCPVLKKKKKFFSEQTFLHELGAPESCFTGWLEGVMGDMPISGEVASGFTASEFNSPTILTAASRFKIFDARTGKKLGKVYTLDAIFDPQGDTSESLMMVGGSKRFKHGTGDFEVFGNALSGASFRGEICPDDD